LNGAFKINLTKAKCRHIAKGGVPRFKPTDIVPLVNQAFPKSFCNSKSVVKVIAKRGWNPLNYNLLTFLPNMKVVVDLTIDSTCMSTFPCLPPINITEGPGTKHLDMLIKKGKKDEG
jgi:hypothetical protein